ncbi:MAG: PucR family transcriptional regulator [Marmoricola sp.]
MAVTLRDVLALPSLRGAGAEVVEAAEHLDRPVRWVHVTELPDIAHLLKGGELLLTTGLGLRSGGQQHRRFVRQVAEAGVAGVLVELGPGLREIPAGMRRAARQSGLPLIAVHRETRFVEITEEVHRAIISQQYETLRRVEEIGRAFTTLLLDGADTQQVLARLAREAGNPVVLENGAHQVVGYADPSGAPATDLLAAWDAHSRSGHHETARGSVHRADGDPSCAWVSIWLRHDSWGRVHVLETHRSTDERDRLVLDRAGMAVGLSMLSRADAENVSDRAASAVIADLLGGRILSGEEVLRRAGSLGSDLAGARLVALAVAASEQRAAAGDEARRQRLRLQVRAELRAAIREHDCQGLLALDGDQVLAILAVPRRLEHATCLAGIAGSLRRRVDAVAPGARATMGASRTSEPDDLPRAFEEARIAVQFGRDDDAQVLHRFGDLGTYPLLVRLARGPELAAFVESEIGPVLQHDAQRPSPLLPTLRAFLGNAGRKADAVRELHVQRRTLYARLARLEGLLGRSLDDQQTRTRLTLALQGLDVLGRSVPRRGG